MVASGGHTMMKAVLVGTTALAIAGSALAYAQQRPGRDTDPRRWQPNVEDIHALGEARLAALKAGLALNVEQEKNWPAFAAAARDLIKLRSDRMSARMAERGNPPAQTVDPIERLRARATGMSETGNALRKLAEAADPLYKSLDEGQKRRFAMLNRMTGPRGDGPGGGPGREFGGRDGGPGGARGFDRGPRREGEGFDRGGGREGYGFRGPESERFSRGPGGYDRGFRGGEGERFDRGPGRYQGYDFERGFRGPDRDGYERGPRRSEGYGFGPRRFDGDRYERGPGRYDDRYDRGPRRFDDRYDRDRRGRTTGGPDADAEDF
jgi:hypothetical protein